MIKHRYPPIDERLHLQAVDRTLDVLECFALPPSHKSLGDIAAATGLNKSAVQRIGRTLVSRGYLQQDEDGKLKLGATVLDRAFDFLRNNPLIQRASPILVDLRRETGERVDLSLFDPYFDNLSIIYAYRLQSKRETFYATLPGRRFLAASTSGGRACLSQLPEDTVDEILEMSDIQPLTAKTILDRDVIREKIKFGRDHGFCYTLEEAQIGEIVVAAAVRNGQGLPMGAVHIAGSLNSWTVSDYLDRFAPLAMSAAQAASG